ncbi:hypothetical protein [Ensifer sp. LCM 4579]|uniref:hypothetical protein n=1 Tax=Ensifer sp. LCM 4579 TaxID=1848292 RepID=UPI0008D930F1|nr:hypothetical protein [Ensifer sp. LCM 4579]OHV73354.1 hypothetical protein LCM4579_10560 [Ensifer sp. LCM 4579]
MSKEIAQPILAQLGGNRFLAMTGAKNLLSTGDGFQFDLPRGLARNKATKVRITLTVADTYTVEFFQWNARRLEMKPVGTVSDVYAEDLRRIFTAETGLDCTLGAMRAA